LLLLANGGGDDTVSSEPWVPRSRSHVVTFPHDLIDRAEMDSAVIELAKRALDEVVAAARTVIRVAVTVRTGKLGSACLSTSTTMSPPLFTSATIRSALCVR